jgi:hypothetical protein
MNWDPNITPGFGNSKAVQIFPSLSLFATQPSPFNVDDFLSQMQGKTSTFNSAPTENQVASLPCSLPPSPIQYETDYSNRESYTQISTMKKDSSLIAHNTAIMQNPALDTVIDTFLLRLYPTDIWSSGRLKARDIIEQYFQRRSSKKMPFHYKLYNALQITAHHPHLIPAFGCQWITANIFKIYRVPFANLLGVASINGALFNKQGSLPTHGFVSLPPSTLYGINPRLIEDVDNDSVRLFKHVSVHFHTNSTEQDLQRCRWRNPRSH